MSHTADMRKLLDENKIGFRSIPEVNAAVGILVARAVLSKDMWFKDGRGQKRAKQAAVLNAVILWTARQSADVQGRILREGMAELLALLQSEAPASEVIATTVIDQASREPTKTKKRGRKKKA